MPFRLVLLLLAFPFHGPDPRPRPDRTCRVASDCDVTNFSDDCCPTCTTSGSTASVAALNAYCRVHPRSNCPVAECARQLTSPRCVDGACTLNAP